MQYSVSRVMKHFGDKLLVLRGEEKLQFRGFLQHFDSHSRQNMEFTYGPLGEIPKGQYILMVPVAPRLQVGDVILRGELKVIVRRLELFTVGDKPVYYWGLCEETEGLA